MISNGGQIDHGIKAILGMADYCHAALSTSVWPAWAMCNIFFVSWTKRSLVSWYGIGCNSRCFFGNGINNKCICRKGYWGAECKGICPGGLISPCSNHGICSASSGTCGCRSNWRGSQLCDRCSYGYKGSDCSVSVAEPSSNAIQSSTLVGEGFTRTLDGARVRINNTGEFVAFKSARAGVEVQTRLRRRRRSVVMDTAAVKVGTETVSMVTNLEGKLSVAMNGKPINAKQRIALRGNGYVYESKSRDTVGVTGPDGVSVTIYKKESSIDLELNVPRNICKDAVGLFGACNATGGQKHGISASYNISTFTKSDLANFTLKWKVVSNNSLIQAGLNATGLPPFITAAGSCILITQTGVVTPPLVGVFKGNYISLQVMFKVSNSYNMGTLLSLGRNTTLALVINGTLLIYRGKTTIDTGIIIDSGQWLQCSVSYQRLTQVLQVFITRSAIKIESRVYVVKGDWFESGSVLGLGLWVVSLKSPIQLSRSKFAGWIDDVRIWNKRLDAVTIQAMWGRDVAVKETSLAAVWKMNEGGGRLLRDGVGKHHTMLPPRDAGGPRWVAADYKMAEASVSVDESTDFAVRAGAEKQCYSIIYSAAMNKTCLEKMKSGASFYYTTCVEGIVSGGNASAEYDALLAYSIECKTKRGLSELPGRELCNKMPGGHFGIWYGPKCNNKCVYGAISTSNVSCDCDKGYWGAECNKTCPGGAILPCHGNGVCDAKTGKCLCNANFKGSSVCDKCSDGWFGSGCQYVVEKRPRELTLTCSVGEVGVYRAFDKLQFRVQNTGRYVFTKAGNLTVYVDHVMCYRKSFCVKKVSIDQARVRVDVQVSSNGVNSPEFRTDGNVIRLTQPGGTVLNRTLHIRPVDSTIYEIQVKDVLLLRLTQVQTYFKISLTSLKGECSSFTGLCGSCKTKIDLTEQRFKSVGTVSVSHYALHSLYFEIATVYSKKIMIMTSSSLTFDFLVKSCKASKCGGPMITYSSTVTFCISNYVTVRIYIGDKTYDTGIATESDKWNQIFVTISKATLTMDVYIVSSASVASYRTFTLKSYPISNGGAVAVGSWMPSLQRTIFQPKETFRGEIDEFRLWGKFFDFATVTAKVFSNPKYKISGLLAAWKFDEGIGNITADLVSGLNLYLPRYPLKKPIWKASDAPLSKPDLGNEIDDAKIRQHADTFCADIILKSPMAALCTGIKADVKDFYVKQCIEIVVTSNRISASLSTVINYSDYCQGVLKLEVWPAQPLCNRFPGVKFPKWIGDDCNVPCINGDKSTTNPNKCQCDFGYWGKSCNETCGGGLLHPCSDHGVCDINTGKCLCDPAWAGNSNCSTCSSGLTGKDCSIVDNRGASKDFPIHVAHVSFQGFIAMFRSTGFIVTTNGEFVLFYSSKFKISIKARFVSCYEKSSCLVAFSLTINSNTIVVRAPFRESEDVVIWLSGNVRDIYRHPITMGVYDFEITRVSSTTYNLRTVHGNLQITISGKYLSLFINMKENICEVATGLLGNCVKSVDQIFTSNVTYPACRAKDFKSDAVTLGAKVQTGSITQTVVQAFISQHVIKECDSSFIYEYNGKVEFRNANAGYSLKFNSTAFVIVNTTSLVKSEYLTIEFMIRVMEQGTILSCGYDIVFVLAIENRALFVLVDSVRYNTTLSVELDTWNQIVLQWNRKQRTLTLAVFDRNGTLERNELTIHIEVFATGHVLAFGQWQPAMNTTNPRPRGSFVGYLDEIKIWSREFSPALIWQLWARRVEVDADGLLNLFELNSGQGVKVYDKRTAHIQGLATTPWRSPEWKFSSLKLDNQPRRRTRREVIRNTDTEEQAARTCKKLINSGSLAKSCDILGQGVAATYFKSCYSIVTQSGKSLEALKIVVIYADYCMFSLNLTFWPAREFCSLFSRDQQPLEMYDRCNSVCVYGKEAGNSSCECIKGYWGKSCNNTCPGGAMNPCNNNGKCNLIKGDCDCVVNWNGSADCSVCKQGWIGKDCSFAVVSSKSYQLRSFFISGSSLMLINGAIIDFKYVGTFVLMEDKRTNIRIEILQVPCHLHKVCTKAVTVRFETKLITLVVAYNNNGPGVYIDDRLVILSKHGIMIKGIKSSLIVRYVASNEIMIERDINYRFRVRFFEGELAVTVLIKDLDCSYLSGLVSHCSSNLSNTTTDDITKMLLASSYVNSTSSYISSSIISNFRYKSAEYALYFNQTMAISSPLCTAFRDNMDITFEILLKPYNENGVIFAYAKNTTFSLFMSNSFQVSIGEDVLDTGIQVRLKHWVYVGFLWKQSLKRLEVYIRGRTDAMERRTFFLGASPFVTCGLFSLGRWLPSNRMLFPPVTGIASFETDEIRIWNRVIDAITIQQNYHMNVITSYQSLTALWKLNEGNYGIIKNLISNEHIYLPEKFAKKAKWMPSSVDIKSLVSSVLSNAKKYDEKDIMVQTYCRSLFSGVSLMSHCNGLPGLRDLSFLTCVRDVTVNDYNKSFAVMSVVTFSDQCQSFLNLTSWPGRKLCSEFQGLPFPYWIGERCDISCIFGNADANNTRYCKCENGYWGQNCSEECPGGADNPCHGHGICDSMIGTCECQENWKGDRNCSACTANWSGGQCDILRSVVELKSFAIMPGGSVISLNATHTRFANTGEYYLFRNIKSSLAVNVLQGRCYSGRVPCVKALAINMQSTVIKIIAPMDESSEPMITVNGTVIQFTDTTLMIQSFKLVHISHSQIEVNIKSMMKIHVRIIGTELSVTAKIANSLCDGAISIAGSCSGIEEKNYTANAGSFESAVLVHQSQLILSRNITQTERHLLEFNGVGISTNVLTSVYMNTNLTIEIRFVASQRSVHGATLLSYSKDTAFGIILKRTVQIVVSTKIYNTGFKVEPKVTNQVTLVYEHRVRLLTVYYINSRGLTWFYHLKLPQKMVILESLGVLSIGQWLSSQETRLFLPVGGFEGRIETVRIWRKMYGYLEVKALFDAKIAVQDAELISSWDFSEGSGRMIRDLVSNIDFYLPADVKAPKWVPVKINKNKAIVSEKLEFASKNLKAEAYQICSSLIYGSPLFVKCKKIGRERFE